jgi:hypothetical protein
MTGARSAFDRPTALFAAEAALAMTLLALAPAPSGAQLFEDRFPFQNRRQRGSFDWFEPAPQPQQQQRQPELTCRALASISDSKTGAAEPRVRTANPENPSPETTRLWPNSRKCRGFAHIEKCHRVDRTGWLGRQDSNLGMAESKSR